MEQLGRYLLVSRLSSGGMGELFLARQEGPAGFVKTVAVKRILKRHEDDQTVVELFLNEARLAALLSHPNVVQIFDLGEADGSYFLVMEYIAGKSLRELIQRLDQEVLPPEVSAYLVSQALHGLHHAHSLRDEGGKSITVVHRDVSPENILVTYEGQVKLVDFGLASAVALSGTALARRAGKRAYMAPEQSEGAVVGPAADIFAAGVVLQELLNGPLESPAPTVFQDIVKRAMHLQPEERYESADAMAKALEERLSETLSTSAARGLLSQRLRELFTAQEPSGLVRSAPLGTLVLTAVGSESKQPSVGKPPRATPRARIGIIGTVALGVLAAGVWWTQWAPASSVPEIQTVPQTSPRVESAPPPTGFPIPPVPAEAHASTAPPEPKRAPRKSSVVAYGKLEVRVSPWAEVFHQGKSLGITPLPAFKLPSGRQVLTLKNPELGVLRTLPVQVAAGKTSVVRVDLYTK